MKTINLKLKSNPYNIYIEHNLTKKIPVLLKKLNLGNLGIVITSPKIYSAHKRVVDSVFGSKDYKIIMVPNGESAKSEKTLFKVINKIVKADGIGKKIFIICLGGGTIGDLGGFAASIYKRGMPYVQIPTTLLAQIDSSIGGKTAIDLKEAKNILGSFYQPKAVFIDPTFLNTLPLREKKQGLAEAIKYGVIKDKNFFDYLKRNYRKIIKAKPDKKAVLKVVEVCASIKAKIVEEDEKDTKGVRAILNFGHTFGHALEAHFEYKNKNISHGEAVAIGMVYAGWLSLYLGYCSKEAYQEIVEAVELFSLPTKAKFNPWVLYKTLTYDKKFTSGKIRMILIKQIGKVEVVEGILPRKIRKTLTIFNQGLVDI